MTPFRISKLEIHNIGPFGAISLDFPEKPKAMSSKAEIHILAGINGTGKSSVLEVLAGSLHTFLNSPISKKRYADNRSFYETSFSDNVHGKWTYKSDHNAFMLENGIDLRLNDYWKAYSNWSHETFSVAFFAYSGYRRVSQINVSIIDELKNHPFEKALDFQNSINPQLILQWITNTISKEALAKNQNDGEVAQKYRSTINQLEQAISRIIEQTIRFKLEYEPINVRIEVDQKSLDFNQLPDGLKSIISWLSDLLMRMDRVKWENNTPVFERNFILFLDEIEVHLHPAWQRKILPAVQSLFPNAQIFVSSHSPFVVGSVDGAWIHKLVKPNGDTQLAGPPILSEDSRSYWYWLNEVFDIKAEFGLLVQQDLDKFYQLRDALLVKGTIQQRTDFQLVTKSLLNQHSQEIETIVGFELRQLNKRLAEPIKL